MTVAEILNSVKFVIEPNRHQSAVVVDLEVWEQIVSILEDAEGIKKARSIKEESIPWKTAKIVNLRQ